MDGTTCPTYGESFDSRRGLGVHHSSVHDERLPNRQCRACGEEFYCEYDKKYCSEACRDTAVSFEGEENPNYGRGKETTACDLCGSDFTYYPSEKPGLYCGECVENATWRELPDIEGRANPRWRGGTVTLTCVVCESEFERYPSQISSDTVLCSTECHSEWLSESFAGEGHPNWRGGGVGNYGRRWNAVRRRALERDGHECVLCGTSRTDLGRNPDVHHITPVRVFAASEDHDRTDAHRLDNVVTLCPSCHRSAEFGGVSKERLRRETTESDH